MQESVLRPIGWIRLCSHCYRRYRWLRSAEKAA